MAVPLSLFAATTADGRCEFSVIDLAKNSTGTKVILGATFFGNFFGVFTNQYENDS